MIWLYIWLALFVMLTITLSFATYNLLKKNEHLESWFEEFEMSVKAMDEQLRIVDSKGHFETDDEVGIFFESLKEMQAKLSEMFEIEEK